MGSITTASATAGFNAHVLGALSYCQCFKYPMVLVASNPWRGGLGVHAHLSSCKAWHHHMAAEPYIILSTCGCQLVHMVAKPHPHVSTSRGRANKSAHMLRSCFRTWRPEEALTTSGTRPADHNGSRTARPAPPFNLQISCRNLLHSLPQVA